MWIELGSPIRALHEYDKLLGNLQRDFTAFVQFQQAKGEIDCCRYASGRVEVAVLNIRTIGFDTGGRAKRCERVGIVPVSGDHPLI